MAKENILTDPQFWAFVGSQRVTRRQLGGIAVVGLAAAAGAAASIACNDKTAGQVPKTSSSEKPPQTLNSNPQARLVTGKEDPARKIEIQLTFQLKDLEGKTTVLDLERYKGKPLILAFYDTHMSNVFNAAQIIEEILPKIPQDSVQIIGIAHFSTPSEVHRSIQSTRNGVPYPFPVYTDPDRTTKEFLDLNFIQGFPAFVVINSQGKVTKKIIGNGDEEKQALLDTVQNLIQSK